MAGKRSGAKGARRIARLENVPKARYFIPDARVCNESCPPRHDYREGRKAPILALAVDFLLGAGSRDFTFS
jgi:hypothetical protein